VKKFTSDNKVDMYVGVDISPEQLKDCEERARANRRVKQCITCLGDAATGTWKDVIARATGLPSVSGQFNVAWCMFALHYFCNTEDNLRRLFTHVSDALAVGGKFACTFPNPYYIFEELKRGEAARDSCGDEKIYQVQREDGGDIPFTLGLDDCLKTFGHVYRFSLGDAVQVSMVV
jgi:SAM-dependent methyltransferase